LRCMRLVTENIGLSSQPTGLADGLGRKRLTARRLAALRPDYLGPPFPLRKRDSALRW